MAFANGYLYRRAITVQNAKVGGSANLTNFPMLFSTTNNDFKSKANSGKVEHASGYDIVFASDVNGSTALKHEIEKYGATTGEVVAWVKVPTLDYDDDTTIYMFYGNSSISAATEDPPNVWRSEYKMVLHLHDDFEDSTTNNNDVTNSGTVTATGQVADGRRNDNTDTDVLSRTYDSPLNFVGNTSFTIWAKSADVTNVGVFGVDEGGGDARIFYIDVDSKLQARFDTTAGIKHATGGTISANTWYYLSGTYNSAASGGTIIAYINGGVVATTTSTGATLATIVTNEVFTVGNLEGLVATRVDYFDEARVYAGVLTTGWLLTEYNNQNDPSTFYTLGDEVTTLGGGAMFFHGGVTIG